MKSTIRAAAAVSGAAVALALAPAAGASSYAAGCQLSGAAQFGGSGLQGIPTEGPFTYSFHGSLSNCLSSISGAPPSGTVFAGEQGLKPATGSGSCAFSGTAGESVVKWSDGKYTVIDYKTIGATAGVALTGSVAAATSETTPVLNAGGNPTGTAPLFSTNEPATPIGSNVGGALIFQVSDPSECLSGVTGGLGVTSATISGAIGDGSGPVPLPALPAPPPVPTPTPPIDIGPFQ